MRTTLLTIVAALVAGFAGDGPAYAATWKETQKGGWERTCHDGGRTGCTVWENSTQQIWCRGCAETPYKVQPPIPGEAVVQVPPQPHHITTEEMIDHQISNLSQNVQDFAAQFKQFTGTDFTNKVVLTLQMWGDAAAVDVSMAELSNVIPSSHDSRHCPDTTCFEQWLYTNLEAELPAVLSEKGSRLTKMVTSDRTGREESVQYCNGKGGVVVVIACVIDIEGKKKAYWFALKDQKGVIAEITLPKLPKTTQ